MGMATGSNSLRPGLPPLPPRIRKLPIDNRGYPVPWFVSWTDGNPDFRVADQERVAAAHEKRLCWVCGERLRRYVAFVGGPLCALTSVSAEPPCHRQCAEFAVTACPFLMRPKANRRESGLPDYIVPSVGSPVKENPGVALVWITRTYRLLDAPGGHLFEVGPPSEVRWYAEGRAATREEAVDAIAKVLPHVKEAADSDPEAERELQMRLERATVLLPLPHMAEGAAIDRLQEAGKPGRRVSVVAVGAKIL